MVIAGVDLKKWLHKYALLSIFLIFQIGYWYKTADIEPDIGVVPDVPGRQAMHALTFGDDEFYFRVLAFTIQNAGDNFGRFTSLRYYDFNKLYHWFNLLDELDHRSDMIPAMASYYFSQTQNTADVRYIADYLYDHSVRDVEHKWWWLLQAIYLSIHKLSDMDMAIKAAKPLQNDKVPVWAREMTAVVYEKRGELEDALHIMETIKENAKNIPDRDLKYITYFVEQRLSDLDKKKKTMESSGALPAAPLVKTPLAKPQGNSPFKMTP